MQSPVDVNRPTPIWPSIQETSLVACLALAVLAMNLLTASRIPIPWMDEILYADPAVNLLLGNGFTSTAWFNQQGTEFWAAYPPLYPFVLSLWMKVFGISAAVVRSLNYVLVVLAALIVWVAMLRLDLVSTARHRVALVALLLLGYGPVFCYRAARGPDSLGIFLFAALLFSVTASIVWQRRLAITLLCVLLTTTGLQLSTYVVTLGVLLVLYLGRRVLPELVAAGVGLACGAVVLGVLYSRNGVLDDFIVAIVSPATLTFRRHGLARIGGFYKDPSFVLLLGLAFLLAMSLGFRRVVLARSALGFGIVVAFVVPTAIAAVGHYPVYYSWMAFVPLSIGVCTALSGPAVTRPAWGARVAEGLLTATCLVGLPLTFALSAATWAERDPARVERIVGAQLQPDDRVFADYQMYYAVKQRAAAVFLPTNLKIMSREERERLTVLIVNPDDVAALTHTVGGHWHAVGDGILADAPPGSSAPSIWGLRYNFRIYRRE